MSTTKHQRAHTHCQSVILTAARLPVYARGACPRAAFAFTLRSQPRAGTPTRDPAAPRRALAYVL